ncbi:DUF2357 domain-containing protein [bacterium]|nr:MAG: DUF2357 domain-containing protein [bacterium]
MTSFPPFLSPEKARFLPIPSELQPAFHPAKLCLFEWTDYWFQWPGATHLRVGDERIEPFAPGLFRVRFENAIDAATLEPLCGEKAFDIPLYIEVLSPKFPTPESHLSFFKALLEDLFASAAPLPFALTGSTSRGVERSHELPSPYWTRLFLAQNSTAFAAALRRFLAQPNPVWERDTVWVDTNLATRFDANALLETVHQGGVWRRENGRFKPTSLAQTQVRENLDTPENRFVGSFAKRLGNAIDHLECNDWRGLRSMCAQTATRFPFASETDVAPPHSLRRAVTRELVGFWHLWSGVGAPLFARFERAAKLRDIAQLFEFWSFFVLCEEIGAALGETPQLELFTDEPRGLHPLSRARFSSGTLVYNGAAPSYSTPLRPDFLWLENGAVTLAFDAKFRLEAPQNPGEMSGRGADLHKMHAYRDALGVRAAVAIHPGTKSVFFERAGGGSSQFSLTELLNGDKQGVGLWARQPGY